ncbi:YtxH domain-containing protein [Nocardioides hankookensis]|uniref:YtxH domain-containing protein n=1 Tax=Nocardioides hankookensis TaxID=443157 RepID=A0ABW1LNR1_9ACTN
MAGKISFLVGFGAGYVLGARAGRERYEQIANRAQGVWQDPRVQRRAGQAQEVVKEKAGEAGAKVAEKASEAGSKVAEKVSEKVGSDSPTTAPPTGTGR